MGREGEVCMVLSISLVSGESEEIEWPGSIQLLYLTLDTEIVAYATRR